MQMELKFYHGLNEQCKRVENNHVKWAENDRLRTWAQIRKTG